MVKQLIDKLYKVYALEEAEWLTVLDTHSPEDDAYIFALAQRTAVENFGHRVYMRGLIEFTNFCKNNCYYCGIRAGNNNAVRYRLSKEEILKCCENGYGLGFRTFVLQGGEDPYFTDEILCDIVSEIKARYGDCAVTMSVGERSKSGYQALFDAGADRYLLRHETADADHYRILHPENLNLAHRMHCLQTLKDIGFQVGAGFMVGSPGQTDACLVKDLLFLQEFRPHMVGIGPFIPHHDTPLRGEEMGSTDKTLLLLALIRIMLPQVLLPATTALGTAAADGRERGILAGANVVMPNLSPIMAKKNYTLYDNKICTGEESAECVQCLGNRMKSIGYEICVDKGDSPLKNMK